MINQSINQSIKYNWGRSPWTPTLLAATILSLAACGGGGGSDSPSPVAPTPLSQNQIQNQVSLSNKQTGSFTANLAFSPIAQYTGELIGSNSNSAKILIHFDETAEGIDCQIPSISEDNYTAYCIVGGNITDISDVQTQLDAITAQPTLALTPTDISITQGQNQSLIIGAYNTTSLSCGGISFTEQQPPTASGAARFQANIGASYAVGSHSIDCTLANNQTAQRTLTAVFNISVSAAPVNQAPTANAGANQSAAEQTTVSLNGSGADTDGSIASYAWLQTSGSTVTLQNANTASASFTAPDVSTGETLGFELTVTDNDGASAKDSVQVSVIANQVVVIANQAPVANAGANQSVDEQAVVTLSGSGTDTDGSIASFAWAQTSGTNVTLQNANTATASFTAPNVSVNETLSFELTVTDNNGASANASVAVTVIANQAPTAIAGANQTVTEQTTVTLNGSGTDTDGTISSFAWVQTSGTNVTLQNANTATASFTAPAVTASQSLVFELTVSDNDGASATNSTTITVLPAVPSPPTTLTAYPRNASAKLSWAAVSTATSYTVYYATETLGNPADITNIASFTDGTSVSGITGLSHTVTGLDNFKTYHFAVSANNDGGESNPSDTTSAYPAVLRLNDTGITLCGDYAFEGGSGNHSRTENCANTLDADNDPIPAGQDGHFGRDVTHNDNSDGLAGFSYTKLDANGNALPADANEWFCVEDNITGLIWEVKTTDGGLHDSGDGFSWFNTDPSTNGGAVGVEDEDVLGVTCEGYDVNDSTTYCNTEAYTNRVNTAGLCGSNDWRLPNIKELASLTNKSKVDPAIDEDYFPHSGSGFYWSSSLFADCITCARGVSFFSGNDGIFGRRNDVTRVRLVRGGQ